MNHEEAVIRAFIIPVRQNRYLEFVQNPKKRNKFISQLPHFKHLNPKFVLGIPGNQQHLSSILIAPPEGRGREVLGHFREL